jgi:hypothetical protein
VSGTSTGVLPGLYCPIAQNAATKKDVSYADFLEEVLRAERDVRRVRSDLGESYRLKDKRRAGIMARPAKVNETTE